VITREHRLALWHFVALAVAPGVTYSAVAEEVVIDFESDVVETMARRFTSVSSPLATFSGRLWVRSGLPEFDGVGIETSGPEGITIEFSKPITSLSILFGNDDPGFPEDRAFLRALRHGTLIGQETLLFNRNDLPDQTITITTHEPFNKAVLDYVDSSLMPVSGLGEVISAVRFYVTPEPSSLMLASVAACYAVINARRSSRLQR
jgi:hypothetical protein